MKTFHKTLLLFIAIASSMVTYGQSIKENADSLVKQGVILNDAGKYSEAIDKYQQALKIDPKNPTAYYELSYTLFSTGKGKDAIPYLKKLITTNPNVGGAYDMLGSIYDDDKQPEKAIEYFRQGIKLDPNYQRLYLNLAISYLRQGKNADAENTAIEAIKLDPKHASSQRVYALALTYQNKRGCAILAWCNFLLLEPQTERSVIAFDNVKNLINHGISKTDKHVNANISEGDLNPGNLSLPLIVLAATENKKDLTPTDSLTLQLTKIFKTSATFAGENSKDTFFNHYYADYFKSLAESGNMPAFIHIISISVKKDENIKWLKDHDKQLIDFDNWVAMTRRRL